MTQRNRPFAWSRWLGLLVLVVPVLALVSTPASARAYWYETYQQAVRLIDEGRVQEASPLLAQLVAEHPEPEYAFRLPGNRNLHYLPYYQRARIELALEEYEAAARSLDLSESYGAVLQGSRVTADLERLRERLHRRVAANLGR
jgi:hypothetical protein